MVTPLGESSLLEGGANSPHINSIYVVGNIVWYFGPEDGMGVTRKNYTVFFTGIKFITRVRLRIAYI